MVLGRWPLQRGPGRTAPVVRRWAEGNGNAVLGGRALQKPSSADCAGELGGRRPQLDPGQADPAACGFCNAILDRGFLLQRRRPQPARAKAHGQQQLWQRATEADVLLQQGFGHRAGPVGPVFGHVPPPKNQAAESEIPQLNRSRRGGEPGPDNVAYPRARGKVCAAPARMELACPWARRIRRRQTLRLTLAASATGPSHLQSAG